MKLLLVIAIVLLIIPTYLAGRVYYSRNDSSTCAESALETYVGPCSRRVVVFFGRLQTHRCHELGFLLPSHRMYVRAGPCGMLKFDVYIKPQASNKTSGALPLHGGLLPRTSALQQFGTLRHFVGMYWRLSQEKRLPVSAKTAR